MSTTQVEQVRRTQDGLRDQLGRIREEATRVENDVRFESSQQQQQWGGFQPTGGFDPTQELTSIRYAAEAIRERADRAMQQSYQQGSSGQQYFSGSGSMQSSSAIRSVHLVRQVLDVCEQLVVAQATLLETISPQIQQQGTNK